MLHAENSMDFAMLDTKVEQVMVERFIRVHFGGVLQPEHFEHGLTPEEIINLGVKS
jgi:hypothetical protein